MTQMNLFMKQKQSQEQREQIWWLPRTGGGGRGEEWELGISRCKLVYIEWINSKGTIYSKHRELYSLSYDTS